MSIDSMGVTGTTAPRAESVQQIARPGNSPAKSGNVSPPSQGISSPQARSEGNSVQSPQPSRQDVDEAVNRLTKFVAANQSEINFSVDEASGIRVVKIVDRNSNEVIRQMPSEEAVALAQALDKLQGLLIKDKA